MISMVKWKCSVCKQYGHFKTAIQAIEFGGWAKFEISPPRKYLYCCSKPECRAEVEGIIRSFLDRRLKRNPEAKDENKR